MDFFKSLILDVDEEENSQNPHDSKSNEDQNLSEDDQQVDDDDNNDDEEEAEEEVSESSNLWSFGGLIQTISTRSESVLETYRRDLQEFGSGLKKETEMIREVATKAVKDLPASIDVAHGAIDGVLKSISHVASLDEVVEDSKLSSKMEMGRDSVRFSRFETQLNAIQNDVRTFREEPEDLEEFGRWKLGFALIDRGEEIAGLIGEDGVMEGVYKGIVPGELDNETFWFRYFYRVHKLQQQESLRANLVKRAMSIDVDDEEELSWDVDDDEDDEDDDDENVGETSVVEGKRDELVKDGEGGGLGNKKDSSDQDANVIGKEGDRIDESDSVRADSVGDHKFISEVETSRKENAKELKLGDDKSEVKSEEKLVKPEFEVKSEEKLVKPESEVKSAEKLVKQEENSEVKTENSEVQKDNSEVKKDEKVEKSEEKESLKGKGDEVEEEDLEWDEIEDVDNNDENKAASSVEKSDQADLSKRLSAVDDDDEDLSWDIEDDD